MFDLSPGTRILVPIKGTGRYERATIVSSVPMKHHGTTDDYPGWYSIKYASGRTALMHESRFQVSTDQPKR